MKNNIKIVMRILFLAAMVLMVISITAIRDENAKKVLLYIAGAMAVAGSLQYILFLIRPGLFRNKQEYSDKV